MISVKKISLLILIVSAVLFFAGLYSLEPLSSFDAEANLGIIGGADRPTINFYISKILNDPHALLILFSIPCILFSSLALIFSRAAKKHCSPSSSLTALGLSACASLGAYALLIFTSCFFLTNPSKHPLDFPLSICTGMIALLCFILLMGLYCKQRGKKPSILGICFDIAFSLAYTPAFFISYHIAYIFLEKIH